MDHLVRIQRAIDYIEEHLKAEIPFENVAQAAALSPWHFQRVFSSVVGQTLKEYIRKRRLTSALIELGTTDRRILDIALDYQFESQESFSRAFKTLFARTPGECRRQGITSIQPASKPRITYDYLDHLCGGMTMQPTIITIEEKKVAGLGARFISILSPDNNNWAVIPKLWHEFTKRKDEISGRLSQADIGLCEPVSPDKRTHPDECFYLACTEVSNFDDIPEGMMSMSIPAGRYAVFVHKGNLDELGHTYRYIYGSWLHASKEELRDAPDFECYSERFKDGSEDSELDIYIPIR
jgi:AraC family transcriptional regulator